MSRKPNAVLSIAGSDSSSGAGIQADIKTFQDFNEHGVCCISAITCQNPDKIISILDIPLNIIRDQLNVLFDYYDIQYVKTGMLYSKQIVEYILKLLLIKNFKLVIDPIFKASSGKELMISDAKEFLIKELLPKAFLITPNIPEAEEILGSKISDYAAQKDAAMRIKKLGSYAVLLKGGHLKEDPLKDILVYENEIHEFQKKRKNISVHGSGCMLSAAIIANLNKGLSLLDSINMAEKYIDKKFVK
ncbi:MAG: bifunctional hydroxymethylpyrimidine kinase/phosphomethylpyrimidine kinase [Candidatus Lokiarchaeota archaeon]|nr:bifunctional hydroxymethylpyrimidine kinase/phosphomethylpyrimidine kinase [Candidatus Lokiarchaeota archaeon]